ncbi:hypothetical protein F511_38093 [Dorcoceras hygrometricum]|uniref:Uncharacterized protein n=1 Tax=Dorcoceras hygrometricum TaxID=472368 RepID=A0A2Z7A5U3_9LAMI|nr:hypothetical protein F511_38093 [Dorcoceras hygrometricum]
MAEKIRRQETWKTNSLRYFLLFSRFRLPFGIVTNRVKLVSIGIWENTNCGEINRREDDLA